MQPDWVFLDDCLIWRTALKQAAGWGNTDSFNSMASGVINHHDDGWCWNHQGWHQGAGNATRLGFPWWMFDLKSCTQTSNVVPIIVQHFNLFFNCSRMNAPHCKHGYEACQLGQQWEIHIPFWLISQKSVNTLVKRVLIMFNEGSLDLYVHLLPL